MTRSQRFLQGVSLGYINLAATTLLGLWLTPFLLRRLGQQDYGFWLLCLQMTAYLGLLDLGVVALLPREIAYACGRAKAAGAERAAELSVVTRSTFQLVLWQLPLVALAGITAWFLLPAEWEAMRRPFALILVAYVICFPLRVFNATLQGLQDLGFLGIVALLTFLLASATSVLGVLGGLGLASVALSWILSQTLSAALCWSRLRARFPEALPKNISWLPWPEARAEFRRSFWVSVAQVAQVLVAGIDLLIIGKLLGPAAVVIYSCTGKLITVFSNVPGMLLQAALPGLSEMKTSESRERLTRASLALTLGMLLLSGAGTCMILTVNESFVRWWVGSELFGGHYITVLLLVNLLLRHWNGATVAAIFCFGHERHISLITLYDGFVTAVGITIAIWIFGLAGAPLGSLVGVGVISLPVNLRKLSAETGETRLAMLAALSPWFLRLLIVAAAISATAAVKGASGSLLVAGFSAFGALFIYAMLMAPLTLRYPLESYLRPRFRRMRLT